MPPNPVLQGDRTEPGYMLATQALPTELRQQPSSRVTLEVRKRSQETIGKVKYENTDPKCPCGTGAKANQLALRSAWTA